MKNLKCSSLLVVIVLAGLTLVGGAASAQVDPAQAVIREKATKRLYPGGSDEEDLKVMAQVPEALIKVNKKSVQADVMKSMTSTSSSTPNNN